MGRLRQDTLKLAQQVPALRKHLVPLLQKTAEPYDDWRDQLLEDNDWPRRPSWRPGRDYKPPTAPKMVEDKESKIDLSGVKIKLVGQAREDGLIIVELVPVKVLGHADSAWQGLRSSLFEVARHDQSWVIQGDILRRRYWMEGAPKQQGGWPEVKSLEAALKETEKFLKGLQA